MLDASGEFLGLALVPSIDRESREAELGYMVVPSARGRGVATAILRELTAWALREGVQRCELIIAAGNVGVGARGRAGRLCPRGLPALRPPQAGQARRRDRVVASAV